MKYFTLGNTGFNVSEICFGALPMGPLQAGLSVEEGGALILEALKCGVNFVDTAEMYQTYGHVRWALERFDGEVIVATKSIATSYNDMKKSVERALNELGRDKIEIFHLHAARDSNPVVNREEALAALLEYKEKGIIKAVGVANHSVIGIERTLTDPRIDIIFALINRAGLGILDGTVEEMAAVLQKVKASGKGLYAMKALAGGNLLSEVQRNFDYVRTTVGIPVVAVGMIRKCELKMNLALFEGRPISEEVLQEAQQYSKRMKVMFFCQGCGNCVQHCHNGAITMLDGKAIIDHAKCLLCGYCSNECPQFAIRVV